MYIVNNINYNKTLSLYEQCLNIMCWVLSLILKMIHINLLMIFMMNLLYMYVYKIIIVTDVMVTYVTWCSTILFYIYLLFIFDEQI